jgi:hypothetical protein
MSIENEQWSTLAAVVLMPLSVSLDSFRLLIFYLCGKQCLLELVLENRRELAKL